MKVVGCILLAVWAFAGVTADGLAAETPEVSRMSVPRHPPPPHMTDPHWHLRQHLQDEIRRLEESENIEPEERDRRVQCLRGQLQHIDDIGRHHQEMLTRMREHERECLDRFGPRRATPPKRGVAPGDLKRRKEAYDRIRAQNRQNMLREQAAQRERPGRDAERGPSWMDLGPVRLLIGVIALVVGALLVSNVWMGVKAYAVYRKASVVYENKYGNFHSCAFCGQTKLPTHAIYHSVFRRTDVRLREYNIDRCGLAVHTCDKCLWNHRLRYLAYRMLITVGFAGFIALAPVFGLALVDRSGPVILVGVIAIFCIDAIFIKLFLEIMRFKLNDFFHPWRTLADRHPAVAELLGKGYEFDEDLPRLVREGLDTEKRLRTLERPAFKYRTNIEHETYCWMGALQNFNSGIAVDARASDALRYLQERENRRGAPCTAKDLSLQRAFEGIVGLIIVAIIYAIAKLLK